MSGLEQLKSCVIGFSKTLCSLPEKPGRVMAAAIGLLAWQSWRSERMRIENCVDRIYYRMRRQPPDAIKNIVRKAFVHFALVAYELLRFPTLNQAILEQRVTLGGREILDQELKKGKGVILALPHLGNWEILGAAIAHAGYPLNSFYLAQKEGEIGGLLDHFRNYSGIVLHDRDRGGIKALKALRNSGILGMIADQDGARNGIYMNFLGHWVSMPAGPANWSLKTGASLMPLFSLRCGHSPEYRATFLPPVSEDSGADYNERVISRTVALTRWMEEIILQHPEQYLWFYDRFKPRHEAWIAAEKNKNGQMYHGEPRYGS
ncbi:MAG: lysophospholipid acyltransferase family protein [Candidatus Riflebacteria bacterium]|nr:lysophospholipid acyltransferase family protein [Candidatus Riflebacteria bacterium]